MSAVCAACGAPTSDDLTECPNCGDRGTHTPVVNSAIVSTHRSSGGPPDNFIAALAYATLVPAIVFLRTKRYNRNEFVRFHAFQSIALAVASGALALVLLALANLASINLLLIPISVIAAIGIVLLVLVCMIKACQREAYKLPLMGAWAEKQARRS